MCAASVPALSGAFSIVMDASQQGAEQAAELAIPAEGQNTAGALARGAVLSSCADKTCARLDRVFALAQQGDAEAQSWLARQYETGSCGLCKDDPLAVVWLKKAAEAGWAEAQFAVGMRCFFGLGVPQNIEEALGWMLKAAQQGHAEAQYRLAGFFEDGLGTNADKPTAVYWYGKSAELGYPQAQNMLGVLCINGKGMPRDAHAAAVWFERAAVQGYATAQYNLARSYETGDGVDRNGEKALYWYGKAARQGDADAQARLGAF